MPVIVKLGVADAGPTLIESSWFAGADALSVTRALNVNDPVAVGVPLMRPLLEFRLKPSGSAPVVTDQEYGGFPPVAVSVCEYADPTDAPGKGAVVVIARFDVAAVMVRAKALLALPVPLSVTCVVNWNVPAAVGVPARSPLLEFKEIPAGNAPDETDHVYGG